MKKLMNKKSIKIDNKSISLKNKIEEISEQKRNYASGFNNNNYNTFNTCIYCNI